MIPCVSVVAQVLHSVFSQESSTLVNGALVVSHFFPLETSFGVGKFLQEVHNLRGDGLPSVQQRSASQFPAIVAPSTVPHHSVAVFTNSCRQALSSTAQSQKRPKVAVHSQKGLDASHTVFDSWQSIHVSRL